MYRQKSAYEIKNKGEFENLPLADMKQMHLKLLEEDYAKAKSRGDNNFGNKDIEELIVRTELKIKSGSELTPDAKQILDNLRKIDFTNGLDNYKYGLNNIHAIQPNTSKPLTTPTFDLNSEIADPIVKIPEQTKLSDTLPQDVTTTNRTDIIDAKASSNIQQQNNSSTEASINSSNTNDTSSTQSIINSTENTGEAQMSSQNGGLIMKARTNNQQTESAQNTNEEISLQSNESGDGSSKITYIIIIIVVLVVCCGVGVFIMVRKNKLGFRSRDVVTGF